MKTALNQFPQGDVHFHRLPEGKLPEGLREATAVEGHFIVAHSETGHHHTVDATSAILYEGSDPFVAYLRLATDEPADVVHRRSHDTHETIALTGGAGTVWQVRRQREFTPESIRSAAD